jgi:beta-xylosidase
MKKDEIQFMKIFILHGLFFYLRIIFSPNLVRTGFFLFFLTVVSCKKDYNPTLSGTQSIPSEKLKLSGGMGTHDPCIIKANGIYYVFSTGKERTAADPGGISFHVSGNNLTGPWSFAGEIPVPDWTKTKYGVTNLWAPELVYNKSEAKYYLYYAASKFGTNQSGIGVASSSNPSDINSWTDHGEILSSIGQDYNAIDPNVFYDSASGWWYMAWGSFFSGIKIQKMSSMTALTGQIYTLAARDFPGDPIEAPSITKRGKYYYLFVSWDLCCKGILSTYKTIIGRSDSITGPYIDKDGIRMDQGGGTILIQTNIDNDAIWLDQEGRPILIHSDENEIGPGGGDIYQEGDNYYLVHHYYDERGAPTLSIRKLGWDANGWPVP